MDYVKAADMEAVGGIGKNTSPELYILFLL